MTFNVEGDGVLVGVDNGWQTDHDSYQEDNRRAYNGSLIAIVQSTKTAGEFTVTAKADGLESGSVKVTTKAVGDGEEAEKRLDSFYMSKTYYVKTGKDVYKRQDVFRSIHTESCQNNLNFLLFLSIKFF